MDKHNTISSSVCGSDARCTGGTAFALAARAGTLPGRIQLFPCGEFAARDGRPASLDGVAATAWRITTREAATVLTAWHAEKTPLVVDYEHQTQLAAENGKPAPAAGWITGLVWEETRGLFADVAWTARARAHILAGEYRYVSPVFTFDKHTGAVLRLVCAALTNHPALDGMDAAQAATEEHTFMKKNLLEALRAFLSLPAEANEAAVQAALTTQAAGRSLAALLAGKDAEIAELTRMVSTAETAKTTEIAALKAAAPDPAHYVPAALLTAEREKVTALTATVAALKKDSAEETLTAEIRAALADGRLPKSCEVWAKNLSKTDPDSVRSYLKNAVPAAALTAMQSKGKEPEQRQRQLTDEEKYVCTQTGLPEADFLARKRKEDAEKNCA